MTGTGGLGLETSLALARGGASVIVAGRNARKGAEALERIRRDVPGAKVSFEEVDLARLASVGACAERLVARLPTLDLLILNAAVMNPPTRQETPDGHELQFGTNYLGHFALAAGLLPALRRTPGARVVTLSSVAARDGKLDLEDLGAVRHYVPMAVYARTKLACLMFSFELQRRSDAAGWGITSVAAHPGISRTDLLHNAPGRLSFGGLARSWLWFLFQPAEQGALPTLFAATSPDARPGGYYGPDRLWETRGHPAPATVPPQAEDPAAAERLWAASERLAGVTFG